MRSLRALLTTLALLGLVQLAFSGCSTRAEFPLTDGDSTLVYPAKEPGGVTTSITLCRKVSKKTGEPIGSGQMFEMGEKSKVRALIDLENQFALGDRDLMFHLVWLGPGDKEFYTKRIDHTPSDSLATLRSSITISPERRAPGDYKLQVYLFRELIAEKSFTLLEG